MSDSDFDRAAIARLLQQGGTPPAELRATQTTTIVLGNHRADLLQRPFTSQDFEYSMSILCRYPLKPPSNRSNLEFLEQYRPTMISLGTRNPKQLLDVVSPSLLTFSFQGLIDVLTQGELRVYFKTDQLRSAGESEG